MFWSFFFFFLLFFFFFLFNFIVFLEVGIHIFFFFPLCRPPGPLFLLLVAARRFLCLPFLLEKGILCLKQSDPPFCFRTINMRFKKCHSIWIISFPIHN